MIYKIGSEKLRPFGKFGINPSIQRIRDNVLKLVQGLQGVTAYWQRLTAYEARRLLMAPGVVTYRKCCKSLVRSDHHEVYCSVKVDKPKLRNRLRDRLNKLNLDANPEILLKIAEEFNFSEDASPHIPASPPDYHDESGRPHLGPLQVRHASDLIKGKHYLRVDTIVSNRPLNKERCRFEGFEFFEENEESDLKEQWNLKLTPMIDEKREENYIWGSMPLLVMSLCPWLGGLSDSSIRTWSNDMWLEFLPEDIDVCTIALQKDYEAVSKKAKNHPIDWVGFPKM